LTSALYINEDKRIDVTFHSSGLRLLSWKNLGCAIRTFNPMEPMTVDKLIPHPKPSGASSLRLGIRLRLSSHHSTQDGPMYRHSPAQACCRGAAPSPPGGDPGSRAPREEPEAGPDRFYQQLIEASIHRRINGKAESPAPKNDESC
jgi:hypothetical protein